MNVAVAGAGHFHVHHLLEYFCQHPTSSVTALYDRSELLRREIAEKYQIMVFDDLDKMLAYAAPTAIACFDIPSQRAALIARCLEAGISVLADKPPAVSTADLQRIQAALATGARGRRPLFSVLFSERYNPPVRTLKAIIDSGAIGDVVHFAAFRPHKLKKAERPDWFFRKDSGGGILVDLAIHDVDVFHWLTGQSIVEVAAHSGNFTCPEHPAFEDNGQLIFRAGGGITGFIKVDWLTPASYPTHGDCRYFVTGSRGFVEVKTGGDIGTTAGAVTLCSEGQPPTAVPLDHAHDNLYEDFLAAAAGNREPTIPTAAVMAAVKVVLAARKAAETDEAVAVEGRLD